MSRHWIKKTLMVGAVLFGICVAVVTTLSVYLSTNHAREAIQARLNKTIAGSITFESMDVSLWRGRAELKKVVLKMPSQEAVAGLDRLVVNVAWTPLLAGDIAIEVLLLEKPWANIGSTQENGVNLLEAVGPPETPERAKRQEPEQQSGPALPFNLVIRSLEIRKGRAFYEDQSSKRVASVEDLDLAANVNMARRSGCVDLRVGALGVQQGQRKGEFGAVTVRGCLSQERIAPFQIHMVMGASTLNIAATVEDAFEKPEMDVVAQVVARLSDFKEAFNVESKMTGSATAELTFRGRLDDPEMSLRLDCRDGVLGAYEAHRLTLDCSLKNRLFVMEGLWDNATAGTIRLSSDADLRAAFPKGLLGHERDWEAMPYKVSVTTKNMQLSRFLPAAGKMTGEVDAALMVEGKGFAAESISAKTELKADARRLSSADGRRAGDWLVEGRATLDDGEVSIQHLHVEGDHVAIGATGAFDISSERITGSLRVESPDMMPVLTSFGIPSASGSIVLEADVSGVLKAPEARFVFDGEAMHFGDYVFGGLHIVGVLDETGNLELAALSLKNQGSVIEGRGRVGIYQKTSGKNSDLPLDLSLAMRHVQVSDFLKANAVRGVLDGRVHVTGTIQAPEATAHLQGKGVAIQTVRLGDLDTTLGFAGGTFRIGRLSLHHADSSVRASGAIGIFHEGGWQRVQDPVFELKVEEGRIALNDFHDTASGDLAIAATLKGSFSKPEGTVGIDGTKLDFGIQKLDGVNLLATLDGERLLFKSFQVVIVPEETIEGHGWISLDRHFDLNLVSNGVSLDHIDFLDKEAAAKGILKCNIAVTGQWEDPKAYGEISVQGLHMWGHPMEDLAVTVRMENQLARISARHHFNLEGSYHPARHDFSALLEFDETDLEPYLRLADQAGFGGIATGKIEAHGNLEDIAGLQASLDMQRLTLSRQGHDLFHTENLNALVRDRQITVSPVILDLGADGTIQLHGTAQLNGPVAMEIQGEIFLETLAPFIGALPDLEGRLVFSGRVEGTQEQPRISAEVTMGQVGFTVPGLFQRLDDLEGRVQISFREVVVDEVRGKLDGGLFVLTGKMDMDHFRPKTLHAQLKADAVPFRLPDTLDLLLNTDLHMEGTWEKAAVRGDVVLLEGTYYKDVRLSFLPEGTGRKRRYTPPAHSAHPFFRSTSLDVSIKRRDALIVDNNLAYLEINPDLRIVGTLENPVIQGRAAVESGTIQYRKKTFEVKKGFVDFSNPYETEAYIDIEAETTVRHWNIVIALAGTPDALSLKLTSVPPEEEGDILSLLLVGRTTRELIAGEGGAGKSPAQMLAEAMAGTLSDDIKEATGLDTLEVEVGAENGQDAFRVTVGKDLSRRLSVKYVTESKEGNIVERAVAEYRFLENILFSGSQDTEGVFGGEIKYRLEFR